MNKLLTLIFAVLLVSVSAFAAQVPVTVDSVEVDDLLVSPNGAIRLNVERSQDFLDIEVRLVGQNDADNIELRAFISGFEYNDVNPMFASTTPFSVKAGNLYAKRLKLKLSQLVDEDNYKLNLVVSNRNDDLIVLTYPLRLDAPRHALMIKDVILNPDGQVTAGHALLATVRVENRGEKDEKDVKVSVSVPELGLKANSYIEKIEKLDEQEQTEELYLRIPKCAKSGTYQLNVDVEFSQRHKKVSDNSRKVTVLANEDCDESKKQPTVSLGSTNEQVKTGGAVAFPITVVNNERTSKSFTLLVQSDLSVQVSPSNTLIVEAGQPTTFNVVVSTNEESSLGSHVLTALITSGNDLVKQTSLTVNLIEGEKAGFSLRNALEIGLLALVVVLIVLGAAIAFRRFNSEDDD